MTQRLGAELCIKGIVVRAPSRYAGVDHGDIPLHTDANALINDADIDIIVEVIGGEYPAHDFISAALKAGKYVVTANKEVIAKHQAHFFELARANGVDIYFEAAVAASIPIIRSFKIGYAASQIQSLAGILNGTTNYILTKMEQEDMALDAAIKQAQDLGFAEADPTMDISGLDAAYKLQILAAVAFKQAISMDDISYRGIEEVQSVDMDYATELGYRIKLLAVAQLDDKGRTSYRVHPAFISTKHPLAAVHNEFNAVYTEGSAMGEAMQYGAGAGPLATGSAVVSDICDIAFTILSGANTGTQRNIESPSADAALCPIEETVSAFYLRLQVQDRCGALESITHILGEHQISIAKIVQKELDEDTAELVLISHETQDAVLRKSIKKIEELDAVRAVAATYRIV